MPESPTVTFRVPRTLYNAILIRAVGLSDNDAARRDLERYYTILQDELRQLSLTEAEASLICDALNGTIMEPNSYRLLWAEIADAIELDGLDRKWDVDGETLVAKLRTLTPGAAMAIVDAVERFWSGVARGENADVYAVGLVR